MAAGAAATFDASKHARFFSRFIDLMPSRLQGQDANRMTLAFFALSGLDLLGRLDAAVPDKAAFIDWIYAQQVVPDPLDPAGPLFLGFRGGPSNGARFSPQCQPSAALHLDGGHLAMTYTALASLAILGDNLSRVDRGRVAASLKHFQQPDGSFVSHPQGEERDVRFVYCACAVAAMLGDWSGVDRAAATAFVRSCLTYDHGFAQAPDLEAHGGYTFCALASLVLMGTLESALSASERLGVGRWLIMRQESGFNGRPHKPIDTCYSFWVAASLHLLGHADWIDSDRNVAYILSTQGRHTGGLAKWPDSDPDPLHAYMGICGLALESKFDLQPVNVALNISTRAAAMLQPDQKKIAD